jgi:hypothetical protein
MEQLRKITLRNIGLDQATINAALDGQTKAALANVAGIVSAGKPGQSDKGEYLKLIGEFRAINLLTGEQFSSAACILPNFIADQFRPVLEQNGSVEFALQIGARVNDRSVTGYEFTVTPLVESRSSDRMAELIQAATASLPAPTMERAKPSSVQKSSGKVKSK